ncbi:MAG: RnfABCDGE type electron transport complex subunit D [Deltaproteobacteria bacterium]|nr:RnfABCDGE type electron transport complex subunit D [Deltaproteobacteria bacterium]
MLNQKLLVSSHAPFWHNGSKISTKSYNIMIAALPAVLMGIYRFGAPALGVLALSVSLAILWELLMNKIMRRPVSVVDGNAAVIGLMFGMLLPATTPWWVVLTGTFVAVVIGKTIYGGIGCNPFNPALVAVAILILSWKGLMNFDQALVNYDLGFVMLYPLGAVKHFGASMSADFSLMDLLMGRQSGGIGSIFGLGLILGGIYLILRGFIRWEISLSFLLGVVITALIFKMADPGKYAGPGFHLLTGYTLIGAFFLATEDSSSPVNFIPMIIYGILGGFITVLIRNIGAFMDGTVFAILLINVANPIIDKIRPGSLGKGVEYA